MLQMVWVTTSRIGCAYTDCVESTWYVRCYYSPAGRGDISTYPANVMPGETGPPLLELPASRPPPALQVPAVAPDILVMRISENCKYVYVGHVRLPDQATKMQLLRSCWLHTEC
jgi:hypothetical protein